MARDDSADVSKTKGIGTGIYMAPEVTRGDKYSNAVDVFAFGSSFVVGLSGRVD